MAAPETSTSTSTSTSQALLTSKSRFEATDKKNKIVFFRDNTGWKIVKGHFSLEGDSRDKVDFFVVKNGSQTEYQGRALTYAFPEGQDKNAGGLVVTEISKSFWDGKFATVDTKETKNIINEHEYDSVLYFEENENGDLTPLTSEANKVFLGQRAFVLYRDGSSPKPFWVNVCVRGEKAPGAQLAFRKLLIPMVVKNRTTIDGEAGFFAEEVTIDSSVSANPKIPFSAIEMRKVASLLEEEVRESYYLTKEKMEQQHILDLQQKLQQQKRVKQIESVRLEKQRLLELEERLTSQEQNQFVCIPQDFSGTQSSSSSLSSLASATTHPVVQHEPAYQPPTYRPPSPPLVVHNEPVYQTTKPLVNKEPVYQTTKPLVNKEPVYQTTKPLVNKEPVYQTTKPLVNKEPVYQTTKPLVNKEPVYQTTKPPVVLEPVETTPLAPPPPPPPVDSDTVLVGDKFQSSKQHCLNANLQDEILTFRRTKLRPLDQKTLEMQKLKLLAYEPEARLEYMIQVDPSHITYHLYKEILKKVSGYEQALREDEKMTPEIRTQTQALVDMLQDKMNKSPYMESGGQVLSKMESQTQITMYQVATDRPKSAENKKRSINVVPKPKPVPETPNGVDSGSRVKELSKNFEVKTKVS